MNKAARFSMSFVGAIILPIFFLWLGLTLTLGKGFRGTAGDVSWYFYIVVGLASIALLPEPKQTRWFLGIIYVPVAYIGLLFFGLSYACERFGNCL